ncbi:hypothetical protein Clacol_009141 [Clathrus columnatus]|uniref:Kinesin-like protein n=1 Tax=Clathrus columnatus TaxID=1419009 RepID=A0AAV5AM70_9AGAM|nr:hypothetical protein Clacol_009141 [Clathrus columnatus]
MTAREVKVVARLRPFISSECNDDSVEVFPRDGTISVVNPRSPSERFKFTFASCYDQTSTQEEIFLNEVQPLIDHVFEGLVCTVFAYGVTSSGKTHTIQGNADQPGIIPRVVNALLETKKSMDQGTISFSLSYMEIYREEAYDLLVPRETAFKLPIREDPSGKIIVANLTEKEISSFQEFEKLFSIACKGRSTGATNLNHASSRSHAILCLTVSRFDPQTQKALVGKINLVDLAGSENNKLTGNDPFRMAESAAINKSLTVLGQVVHALNTTASRIPYRDSKLTRLLQDALGGSAIGLLICNLAPDTRPLPKVHFSAHAPSALRFKPAVLAFRPLPGPSRISLGGPSNPAPAIASLNAFGFNGGGRHSLRGGEEASELDAKVQVQQSVTDLDEKISRAVQQEVERRLAEREAQERVRLQELEQRELERAAERRRQEEEQRAILMRKHDELNRLLQKTLRKAEKENQKLSDGDEDARTTLSPKRAKKLATAYLSLGRECLQSNEPDYNAALRLWQQAETYIPENKTLKKRITELEIAIREGVPYKISKRSKRSERLVESPVPNSPSGSRDHKESRRLRLAARLSKAKERGELDLSLIRTPSPKKQSKERDVNVDSGGEMVLSSESNLMEI